MKQQKTESMKHAIADAVLELTYDQIDPAAISKAKEIVLYHSWLAFFALQENDPEIALGVSVARGVGVAPGPCTVIANSFKTDPLTASYLNCHLMRGAGYDDVVFPSGMHAALMVVPVAMALSEQHGRSGKEFLASIVAGYEILGHVGKWSWSNPSPRRPSTIFGPLACAATSALLLELNREQAASALGYAAHSAMGLASNLCTHIYATLCRLGILSALYGKAGGACPPDIMEGPLGFYHTYFGAAPTSEELLGRFGKDYAVFMSREKRYPGTLLNTVAIELMRKLVVEHGLNVDNIEAVKATLSDRRERHPTGQGRPPYQTPLEAAASCPFQMALLLLDGDLNFDRYAAANDPDIFAVMDKIQIDFADRSNPLYADVEVRTRDGHVFSAEAEDHLFEPLDARAQLHKYARNILSAEQIERYVDFVYDLENVQEFIASFRLSCGKSQLICRAGAAHVRYPNRQYLRIVRAAPVGVYGLV